MSEIPPEPHTLAGAYAMDALDGEDRARFERHLARCQECTREVSGLREATARLAQAAAVQPPPALKDLVRAATANVRQLPPVTSGAGREAPAPGPRQARRTRRHARPQLPWPQSSLPWLSRARWWWSLLSRARPRTGMRGRGARAAAGLALSLAAVVAATVWVTGWPGAPAPAALPPGRYLAEVLTAPDATMLTARVSTGGHAAVVMSRRDRMLVFTATGLRALPASQCYELWLLEPGRDRPAGVLGMPSHGMAGPLVAAGLRAGDRLGLTVEPASGSARPTSPMLMNLTL